MALTTVAVAAIAAALATGLVVVLLPRLGIIDVPNHRSSHNRPVPRGGGLGVIAGVAAAMFVLQPEALLAVGLVGALVLAAVGFTDDIRSLPAVLRLALQLAVAGVAAALLTFNNGTTFPIAAVAAAFATVWLAGYVNLFNFMDGSNGLAGLNALIASATFIAVGSWEQSATLFVGGLALLGGVGGFLPWNFPVARVFLGDVGSYAIGFTVAWLVLVGLATTDRPLLSLAPAALVLLDTCLTLLRRARQGVSLMAAHREHVYQRLTSAPGSPLPALLTFAFGVAFVAAALLPTPAAVAGWVVLAIAYAATPGAAHHMRSRRT